MLSTKVHDAVVRLEKTYAATIISGLELREEVPALYHWIDDIANFPYDAVSGRPPVLIFRRMQTGDGYSYPQFAIHLFTDRFRYVISAVAPNPEKQGTGYLSATVTERKSLAGDEGHRGTDLPEGLYAQNTWRGIQSAIIRHEMVPLECFTEDSKSATPPDVTDALAKFDDGCRVLREFMAQGKS